MQSLLSDPTLVLLVFAALAVGAWLGHRVGRARGVRQGRKHAHEGRRRALSGRIAENWAPYTDGFPGDPSDARFLGSPVDFVVFDGLEDGRLGRIVFVEVKSGRGRLTKRERAIRDAVSRGAVEWCEHRVEPPSR